MSFFKRIFSSLDPKNFKVIVAWVQAVLDEACDPNRKAWYNWVLIGGPLAMWLLLFDPITDGIAGLLWFSLLSVGLSPERKAHLESLEIENLQKELEKKLGQKNELPQNSATSSPSPSTPENENPSYAKKLFGQIDDQDLLK